MPNKEVAEKLHKPVIRNFKRKERCTPLLDNIWRAYIAVMQLISKFSKGICFLSCVIVIFSKYAWVISLKDKKGITIIN